MAAHRKQHVIFVLISMILIKNSAIVNGQNPNQLSKPKKAFHNTLDDLDKSQQYNLQKLNLHNNADLEQNVADEYQTVDPFNKIKTHRTNLLQKTNAVINGKEDRKNDAIPNKLQTKSLDNLKTWSGEENGQEIQDPMIKEFEKQQKRILHALDRLTKRYEIQMERYHRKYSTRTPAQIVEHEQYIQNIGKDREIYGNLLKENAAQMYESLNKNRRTANSSLVRKTPGVQKPTPQNLPKPTEFMPVKNSSGVSNRNGTVIIKGSNSVSNKDASGISDRNGTVSNKGSSGVSDKNGTMTDSSVSEIKAGNDYNGGLSTGVSRNVVRNKIGSDNRVLSTGIIPTTDHDSDNKSKMKSTDLFGIYHNLLDDLKNVITSRNQAHNLERVVGRKNHKIVMVKFPVESGPDNDQSMKIGLPQKNKEQNIVLTKNEEFDYVGNNANNKE